MSTSSRTSTPQPPTPNAWGSFSGTRRSGRTANLLSLDDFEAAARRVLPRPIFGYVAGAAEDNRALGDNRQAFAELALVPACCATWPSATRA